jgi:hypothetical protein
MRKGSDQCARVLTRAARRGSTKAAVHLPVESASTALQSVLAGNSRVVHGGFDAPAVEDILFIRDAKSRAYYFAYLFSDK